MFTRDAHIQTLRGVPRNGARTGAADGNGAAASTARPSQQATLCASSQGTQEEEEEDIVHELVEDEAVHYREPIGDEHYRGVTQEDHGQDDRESRGLWLSRLKVAMNP